MTELSDWIWLVVAGIWVVTRILPRLFRSGSRKSAPTVAEERPKMNQPRTTSGGVPTQPPQGRFYPAGFDGKGRSKGGSPPPIEPK